MKNLFIVIFFLFQVGCIFSQDNEDCKTTTSEVLSGNIFDYDLSDCTTDLQLTTSDENTIIHGLTLMDAIESINIVATDDYVISIKPNDSNDFINLITTETYIALDASFDRYLVDRANEANDDLQEKPGDLISLFPIPANSVLNIETERLLSYYKIYNQYGTTIIQGSVPDDKTIRLEQLTSGIYYILLEENDKIDIIKFTKN